jgi:hypothetical protein
VKSDELEQGGSSWHFRCYLDSRGLRHRCGLGHHLCTETMKISWDIASRLRWRGFTAGLSKRRRRVFIRVYDVFSSPYAISTNYFISRQLLLPWRDQRRYPAPLLYHTLDHMGLLVSEVVSPAKWLFGVGRPWKLPDRELLSLIYWLLQNLSNLYHTVLTLICAAGGVYDFQNLEQE